MKPMSEEHKRKISQALKGRMPKNIELLKSKAVKFKKGHGMNKGFKKGHGMNKGKNHPLWKGGRRIEQGRILLRINGRDMQESRYVWLTQNEMGGAFGRVPAGCVIHHINFNKLDNRVENLILLPRDYHNFFHGKMKYPKGSKFGINQEV